MKLCKYRSLSNGAFKYTQDIFVNHRLFMPTAVMLNDPNDNIYYYKTDNEMEGWANQIMNRNIRNETRILSFSEVYDNVTMWSHYGDEHRGVCIEFESEKLGVADERLLKVTYSDSIPVYDIKSRSAADRPLVAFSHKSTDWTYEKEWRYIAGEEEQAFLEFLEDAIVAIYLGPRISAEDRRWVVFWQSRFAPQAVIHQMSLALGTYRMEIDDGEGGKYTRLN